MTDSRAAAHGSADSVDPARRRVAFVGGGNMGAALVRGLRDKGWPTDHLRVLEVREERRRWLETELGVVASERPSAVLAGADAVILAVKPQQLPKVAPGLPIPAGALVVSIAAGVRTGNLRLWLGPDPWIVRCMPNTPALVGAGAAALYTGHRTPEAARSLAEALLGSVGTCCWVEQEAQLDVVTALSGSGPAYFFALAEAMQKAATALGLPAATAAALARQTLVGAGQLVAAEAAPIGVLRERVTSKGGTTAAALQALADAGFGLHVAAAVGAAAERSAELGNAAAAPAGGHADASS
ncbi:MAG TPA: pyrroline-5-carboxylate reductase [Nevskiaceae bacterium]